MGPKRAIKREKSVEAGKSELFSVEDRREILAFIKENKEALLSTKNDSGTIENKTELWEELAQQLSAKPNAVVRTYESVRTKWNNLLKEARKDFKKVTNPPTGGGPSPSVRWESEYIIREIGINEPTDKSGINGGIDTGDTSTPVLSLENSAGSSSDDDEKEFRKPPPFKTFKS